MRLILFPCSCTASGTDHIWKEPYLFLGFYDKKVIPFERGATAILPLVPNLFKGKIFDGYPQIFARIFIRSKTDDIRRNERDEHYYERDEKKLFSAYRKYIHRSPAVNKIYYGSLYSISDKSK